MRRRYTRGRTPSQRPELESSDPRGFDAPRDRRFERASSRRCAEVRPVELARNGSAAPGDRVASGGGVLLASGSWRPSPWPSAELGRSADPSSAAAEAPGPVAPAPRRYDLEFDRDVTTDPEAPRLRPIGIEPTTCRRFFR